jgi:hypothetical protein
MLIYRERVLFIFRIQIKPMVSINSIKGSFYILNGIKEEISGIELKTRDIP